MRAAIAGVAVAAAVALLIVVLSSSEPRRADGGSVAPAGVAVELEPGTRACQAEAIPPDAARVALALAPGAGGGATAGMRIIIERGGEVVTSGRPAGMLPNGRIDVALRGTPDAGAAELCIRNGADRPLELLGQPDVVSVEYYRAGDESWWQLGPTVADRFELGKAGFLGPWALWLALAAVVAAWLCAWRALRGGAR